MSRHRSRERVLVGERRVDRSNRSRGQWGEEFAARHLRRTGYQVLQRNWRSPESGVRGELDIIAAIAGGVVICEVKARRTGSTAPAAAAVDERKQVQVRRLAESWLRTSGADPVFVRFDVVAIDGVRLTHLIGAF